MLLNPISDPVQIYFLTLFEYSRAIKQSEICAGLKVGLYRFTDYTVNREINFFQGSFLGHFVVKMVQ